MDRHIQLPVNSIQLYSLDNHNTITLELKTVTEPTFKTPIQKFSPNNYPKRINIVILILHKDKIIQTLKYVHPPEMVATIRHYKERLNGQKILFFH